MDDICEYIKRNDFLFESIVLSGGEYLISPLDTLMHDLTKLRNSTNKKIIIYTNGMFPEKMIAIKDLVDGFHTDMKLPYHLLDIYEDEEIIKTTLGIMANQTILDKLNKSIELTVKLDKGNNQIRSVKYPFMNESAFEENMDHIKKLNNTYVKNTKYYINSFVELKEE
jgi:pyruvate-formate lyase-activating enzyme